MPIKISTLPVGTKIEVPVLPDYQSRFGTKLVFMIADKNHSGYPADSVTLITEKLIQLMAFDAKEPNNSNSARASNGNNRYLHSNLLQWLNSNAAAGAWYSAQHSADAPPTKANVYNNHHEYDAWAGFLAMLEPRFVTMLLDTTQIVAKNTVTDGGGYETVTSKMFLASSTEMGLTNENGIAEGLPLALFSNNASRVAYPTYECVNITDYTHTDFATSKGWYWWLRTPYSSDTYRCRGVTTDGALYLSEAYDSHYGVRPLCNLSSSILVSDTTNADGNYEIVYSNAIDVTAKMGEFSDRPNAVRVILDRNGVLTTLQCCNNYLDNSPAWEDVTEDTEHRFANMTKTSDKWAVGLRVVIGREASEEIYLTEPIVLVTGE